MDPRSAAPPPSTSTVDVSALEAELREHLRFDSLVIDLSEAFIALPVDEIPAQIDQWLTRIADLMKLDLITILQFAHDDLVCRTHSATRTGQLPIGSGIYDPREVPWFAELLRGDQRMLLTDLPDSLPAEAHGERAYYVQSGLKSSLNVRLRIGGMLRGMLHCATLDPEFQWTEYVIQRLELLGRVFTSALDRYRTELEARRSHQAYITQREQVEQALRESETHFRTIFEEAAIGLAYVDDALHIRRVNRFLSEFLGYSAEELWQLRFADITHPDDVDKDIQLARRLFSGELPSYQIEKRYLKKSGEIVWGLLTATLIRNKDGQPICGLGMVENITSRKEVEDQLRQSQKMEAFGQLAGGVAHDFNNLITAINGYSELTLDKLAPTDPLRGNLEEIIKAGTRAAALTRQLLAFSRKQVLRPKVIDVTNVVDDMQKLLRRLIGENIKLVTSSEGKLGRVLVDPSQLEQIIVNLAVNARDAMPKGGKLMIELANVYLDKEYARYHLAVVPGRYVMLAVSDTGLGMSREIQRRIFEPFFTTKEPGKGTGLGLSTVYGIVKQSGGNIWVYSEEGVGTKFKIYLPQVEQPSEDELAVVDRPEVEVPGGSESILLVEDDDSVRNMALRILSARGYDVCVARDGREAIHLCEHNGRPFQLLLTDVIMPKMSGRELFVALQRIRPQMKVLYMSGYSGDAITHHGVLVQELLLLEKPFTMDELLRRVRAVLDEQ